MTIQVLVTDIRDRLMALCERIPMPDPLEMGTAYRDEEECSFSADDLPAFVVKAHPRGNQYEYSDTSVSYHTVREFRIGLYVSHLADQSYRRDMDAMDFCETLTQTVVDYFAAIPTLSLDYDEGLVELARIVDSTAPHTMPTKGSHTKNRGIQFRMSVRFLNFATQR